MKDILKKISKKQILVILFIVFIIAAYEFVLTLPSKYLGKIVDKLLSINNQMTPENIAGLKTNIKYMVLGSFGVVAGILIWRFVIAMSTRTFQKNLTDELFKKFYKLSYASIQSMKNGELMTYLTTDTRQLTRFLYRLESQFTRGLFTLIIVFMTMNSVNSKLTIFTIIPISITLLISILLKDKVGKCSSQAKKDFTNLSEFVQESTDGIRTTKAYSMEDSQIEIFEERNGALKRSNIKVDFFVNLMAVLLEACFGICYAILIGFGGILITNNEITVGELVAFAGYIGLLNKPLKWFPNIISEYKMTKISYDRLQKLCSAPSETILFLPEGKENQAINSIEVRDLSFKYIKNKNILKNISFKLEKGQKLGIIGTTGSGKSTLANLLIRLYDVPNNTIFINGVDINSYDIVQLREKICYITQDNFLFSSSISNNVTLFKEGFEDKDIENSLKLASFSEDLSKLEAGIGTIIGEKGIDLSGGQKQRVAIARAIIKNSDVVIFDDCFSALDNKTEEVVFNNINELFKDKICIVISNRISEVRDSNEIIVLNQGKIEERGKHKNLVENMGLYNKFYYQQLSQERIDD